MWTATGPIRLRKVAVVAKKLKALKVWLTTIANKQKNSVKFSAFATIFHSIKVSILQFVKMVQSQEGYFHLPTALAFAAIGYNHFYLGLASISSAVTRVFAQSVRPPAQSLLGITQQIIFYNTLSRATKSSSTFRNEFLSTLNKSAISNLWSFTSQKMSIEFSMMPHSFATIFMAINPAQAKTIYWFDSIVAVWSAAGNKFHTLIINLRAWFVKYKSCNYYSLVIKGC